MLCPHCKKKKKSRDEKKRKRKKVEEKKIYSSHIEDLALSSSIIQFFSFLCCFTQLLMPFLQKEERWRERERVIRGKGRKVNLSIAIYIHIHSLPHKHSPPYHPHWRWDVGCACGRWLSKSRLIYRRHWGRMEENCVVPWYSHAMHVRSGKMAKTVKLMILLFAWHFFAFLFNLLLLIIISRSISLLSSPKGKHLIANVHV